MKLILKENEEFLNSIPLNLEDFDNIIFGTDKVKEISFIKDVNNSDELKLQSLHEELLNSCDYRKCNNFIVYYDESHFFNFKIPLKDIYYRVMPYMRERNIIMQEMLTLRFEEDNCPTVDFLNNLAICDNHCNYLEKSFCKKYKNVKLKKYYNNYIICENCFMEMWPTLGKKFLSKMEDYYNKGGK